MLWRMIQLSVSLTMCMNIAQELLLLVRTLTACENSKKSTAKGEDRGEAGLDIWGSLRALTYSVLEALQSLLSVPSFVAVTQELLQHQVMRTMMLTCVRIVFDRLRCCCVTLVAADLTCPSEISQVALGLSNPAR